MKKDRLIISTLIVGTLLSLLVSCNNQKLLEHKKYNKTKNQKFITGIVTEFDNKAILVKTNEGLIYTLEIASNTNYVFGEYEDLKVGSEIDAVCEIAKQENKLIVSQLIFKGTNINEDFAKIIES